MQASQRWNILAKHGIVPCENNDSNIEEDAYQNDPKYSHTLYFPCLYLETLNLEITDILVCVLYDNTYKIHPYGLPIPNPTKFNAAAEVTMCGSILETAIRDLLKNRGWI